MNIMSMNVRDGACKITLAVMAAGMGSRFGGLKQMTPVGPGGETILDFSVFDAKRAGFDKVVFIIKPDFEEDFKKIVGSRAERLIDVGYAFQTADSLPTGREKPWGTAHAVLCARNAVDTPFCVINADDFYGRGAFEVMAEHLKTDGTYAMTGFLLENTVTENGTVARGVCDVRDGYLTGVTEHTSIAKDNGFSPGTVVSMNFWGFAPNIFGYLEEAFKEFLNLHGGDLKSEFFLPDVVDGLIKSGKEPVKVLTTAEKWYGVTYREDLEGVRAAIEKMVKEGNYDGI